VILAGLCAVALTAAPLSPADTRSFRSDVDFVIHSIETMHPAPFSRADKAAFYEDAASIKSSAPKKGFGCATAELMALVAELHDGHSYIAPINVPNQKKWYPIRFYAFADGLYVTSVTPDNAQLVGKRVLKIGALDAAAAEEKAVAIQGANNPLGAREGMVWLSQAAIAEAFGAAKDDRIDVTVANADGTAITRTIKPFDSDINDAWYQQGEMFGPRMRKDAQSYVTAFGGRGPLDFRKTDPALPPHLRYRLPYYLVEMPDAKALYFQWNFVEDWGDEKFAQFAQRLFKTLDAHPDWKLIVDVRYNSGGDGSKVPQIIKQIIKRDRFDKPGKLFVIIGRKTFSAAVDFVGEAKEWTSAIFVGEPSGAGLNTYGDPQDAVTPNLKIPFQISTSYHQHAPSQDQSGEFDPDIPAIMRAADYFAGRDPALETILAGQDVLPLPALAQLSGAAAAKAAYAERSAKWSQISWWNPFAEHEMNEAGYIVLRGGNPADAVILFGMNTQRYPHSWNTWDSLGEAQRAAGDVEGSKASYRQALALYPGDDGATSAIAKMENTGR
jgi:tetratricopeptide (TPR) repeat protein